MAKQPLMAILIALFAANLAAADTSPAQKSPTMGAVNFTNCVADSKVGKKEQENFENLRKQMTSMVETTEKDLKETTAKLEDPEFFDSLSPKAEEELKTKQHALQEDMNRYQNQFYQLLQHANYQMMQKINNSISNAAEVVAQHKNLDYVFNRDVFYFINPAYDMTSDVIAEMDKEFDAEQLKANQKLSDNGEEIGLSEDAKKAG